MQMHVKKTRVQQSLWPLPCRLVQNLLCFQVQMVKICLLRGLYALRTKQTREATSGNSHVGRSNPAERKYSNVHTKQAVVISSVSRSEEK